jgi:hypothetical protein
MSVTGPIARTIEDLRVARMAMSAPDPRDPWWVPAPLEGPSIPLHAALCLRRTQIEEVAAAVFDAGRRLADAGWEVEELEDTPPLHEADEVTFDLWFGDGFAGQADANREWNTLLIRKYMTLCSTFTSVCRICTCQIPPKGAFTDILSSDCQVHLIPLRSSLDPISLSIVESDCFQIIL